MSKVLPYILLGLVTVSLIGVTWFYVQSSQTSRQLRTELSLEQDDNAILEDSLATLQTTLKERQDRITVLNQRLGITEDKVSELEETNTSLAETNSTLDQQNNALTERMQALNAEISTTLDSLNGFEVQIADSLAWFQANVTIEHLSSYASIRDSLVANCTSIEGVTCNVRLSCLNYVNEQVSGFAYLEDTETAGRDDQIQSLSAMLDHKGGDCEDFSQLATAELNYLYSYCSGQGAGDVRYIAFEEAEGSKHFVENSEQYYIDNTQDVMLDAYAEYFYPVCGSFPTDWESATIAAGSSYGHCLLGFSDRRVNSAAQAPEFLKNAILIEPQSGHLVADLRSSDVFAIPESSLPDAPFSLTMIITDTDLYSFNALADHYQWRGYGDFAAAVRELISRLSALKQ